MYLPKETVRSQLEQPEKWCFQEPYILNGKLLPGDAKVVFDMNSGEEIWRIRQEISAKNIHPKNISVQNIQPEIKARNISLKYRP